MEQTKDKNYVPNAGDIVWLHFNPQVGYKQAGYRFALVLSSSLYNGRTVLMLCCPITTQIKDYPFEVKISGSKATAVLADRIKSLDWRVCKAVLKGKSTVSELSELRKKVKLLIGEP